MVRGFFRAGVAFDPASAAVSVMFFFPDGNGGFDCVDDRSASIESGVSVGRGNGDADGDFTDLQVAGAVDTAGSDDVVFGDDFRKYTLAFFFCKCWEGLIFESGDVSALVVVAHPTLKASKTTGSRISHGITKGPWVNELVG